MRHLKHHPGLSYILPLLALLLLLLTVRTCCPKRFSLLHRVFSTDPDGAAAQVFENLSDQIQSINGVRAVFSVLSEGSPDGES